MCAQITLYPERYLFSPLFTAQPNQAPHDACNRTKEIKSKDDVIKIAKLYFSRYIENISAKKQIVSI